MKKISLLLLISISTASAAPVAPTATPAAPTAVSTAVPAPAPMPWKIVYSGDYTGPRLSNFSLSQTQGPTDPVSSYTEWDHSLKIGYVISPDVIIGTQIRALNPFDPSPAATFTFMNTRLYFTWKHMIDTSDVDMQAVVDLELPNTSNKNKGMLFGINIKNNWIFKTSLRNWSFSALTLVRPRFYNIPNGKADVFFGIMPSASLDLAPNWALNIDMSFDASHNFNDTYFDFGQNDPDTIAVGIQYSINSHVQVQPGLQFFTADFTVPVMTFNLTAAL